MEELKKNIQESIEFLSKSDIKDLFPKSILYPNQKLNNISDFPFNDSMINNINSSSAGFIRQPNKNNLDLKFDKAKYSSKLADKEINLDYTFKKIIFDNKNNIYDIIINGKTVIACGKEYIKIYNTENLRRNTENEPEFYFYNEDEVFNRIAYNSKAILAAGGKKSIIYILNLMDRVEESQLIGHKNEILDLKFNPKDDNLLLSSSQDYTIRLWNIQNKLQICIFAGQNGHSEAVVSIDWHPISDYFVSSGLDYAVKIWEIDDKLKEKIKTSKNIKDKKMKRELEFKTRIIALPIFSCDSVHNNYIDCVKFKGNFILSKGADGLIKEWLPIFNKESNFFFLINTYNFSMSEKIWYMKFECNYEETRLAVGNTFGELFFFSLDESKKEFSEFDYYFNNNPSQIIKLDDGVIRSISFDQESDDIAIGCQNGCFYVGSIDQI